MADYDQSNDFWENFGDESDFIRMQDSEDAPTGSLAAQVVEHFGLSCKSNGYGGPLANVDIHRMDAIQVINASLLETFAKGNSSSFIEMQVDDAGDIVFEVVGAETGLEDVDIYHTIQTQTYNLKCKGVMVHGGKPLPRRRREGDNPPAKWVPIWGVDPNNKEIYTTVEKMAKNCMLENFNQYATIVYRDPHMNRSEYEDGIDNLYEVTKDNPWDSIVGYAVRKEFTNEIKQYMENKPEITINESSQCIVPIQAARNMYTGEVIPAGWCPDVGELVFPPVAPDLLLGEQFQSCWTEPIGDATTDESGRIPITEGWVKENGIKIEIPEKFRFEYSSSTHNEDLKIDNLMGISSVYILGRYMQNCGGLPATAEDALKPSRRSNTKIFASVNDPATIVQELKEGEHYKIFYYTEGNNLYKTPYLVFVDNSRPNDNAKFGSDCTFYLDPNCVLASKIDITSNADALTMRGQTVIPICGMEAMWVSQVWVFAELETPSITIKDLEGNADKIANGMSYLVKPMVLIDKPAPIGFADEFTPGGKLIDLVSGKQDHDPTTAQALEETDFERALDSMSGGSGLSISLNFLVADEDDDIADKNRLDKGERWVKSFAGKLYSFMRELDGVQTTYICGPSAKVRLGGRGLSGGIVNNIEYSYNDGSSYTISVTEGPKMVGSFAEIGDGLTTLATEDTTSAGVIIQDMGNGLHYKVRIDGYGERIAISTCPSVIRVGDRVSCSIHNNPVEL